MTKLRWCGLLTGLLLLASSSPSMAELGYQTWGLRGGVGVDPDQGIIGVQWNLGNFTRRVRLQPNFELGFRRQQHVIGNLAIPVHYRFGSSPDYTPLRRGRQCLLGYIDYDEPRRQRQQQRLVHRAPRPWWESSGP